jgi:riboflavin synthase
MFTGLIEEIGTIQSVRPSGSGCEIAVTAHIVTESIAIGDSIAIDGACQTVTAFTKESFAVFASKVTAEVTTLSKMKSGDKVNLERALTPLTRMGGHIVQGHVDGTGTVQKITADQSGIHITISAGESIMRYIAAKGSVTVNGISLTVVSENNRSFDLYLIPETLNKTTITRFKQGDIVNIETDIIAKYTEKLLRGNTDDRIMKKLAEGGFM